jgi:hypothetical protein
MERKAMTTLDEVTAAREPTQRRSLGDVVSRNNLMNNVALH